MRNGRVDRVTLAIGVAVLVFGAAFCGKSKAQVAMERSTELVNRLKKQQLPGLPKVLTQAQAEEIELARSGPGSFFVEKGCFACHNVTVYGVHSYTPIGPDLSMAQEDVEHRFGRKLEDFWKTPQGTMMVVRSQLIKLTPDEETEALGHLRAAYAEHQKKKEGTH